LDKIDNPGGMMRFSAILVTPLRGISKKGSIPHVSRLLLVPVSWIPLEVRNKPRSENPIDWGFLTWKEVVFGQSKGCSMAVLGEHSDRLVPLQGYGDVVWAGGLDATRAGDSPEFQGVGGALGCL
jgi:hypothetical protein